MPKLIEERDPLRFYAHVMPFLKEKAIENDLLLGIITELGDQSSLPDDYFLASAVEDSIVEGVVVMTRQGKPLLSYPCSEESIRLFARELSTKFYLIGVKGPSRESRYFSREFTALTDRPARLLNILRCYRLTEIATDFPTKGFLEKADLSEVELLIAWTKEFFRETLPYELQEDIVRERTEEAIEVGQLFLWRTPEPSAMVKVIPTTPRTSRLTFVYTPPEKRGRNYASALVSMVSRLLLNQGNTSILLYTIAHDNVTNRIYPRIGFRPVTELHDIGFGSY